jgi:photosystem II stability/assembly factor-like uncharacterized protein
MKNILYLLLLFLFGSNVGAQSTWHYLPEAPSGGGRIDDVFFLNSQLGWSADGAGRIFKTTDGGATWEKVYGSDAYFRCIEFYNENIGYAGTLDNKFLRSTDGGITWINLAPSITPAPQAVCGISIVDSLYAYAVGQWDTPGFFLKTTDGGISWTSHSMSNHAKALVDVFFLSRDTGFVTGKSLANRGVILYTTDGGQTWTKKFESSATGQYVWKIQAVTTDFWVGSIQTFGEGKFTKSLDGGQTWIEKDAPIADMEGIGFATPQHGWVGSYGDGFYETFDSGENWEFKNFGGNYNRFYFLDSTLAYASGNSIYKFSNNTSSVTPPSGPTSKDDGFKISLSPNPTSAFLEIQFNLPVRDNLRMGIYTAEGVFIREVYHERQLQPGDYQFRADCTGLPPGAYFVGIQRNLGLYSRPFTKM